MSKKAELIGMDIAYEMVYSGDTIQDSNGRKYVVAEHGTCRDASGRETLFRDIQGPRLCAAEKKLSSPSQEAAAAVADQAAAAPRPHAFPDPPIGKKKGGRPNTSGMVRLENLYKRIGCRIAGARQILADAGIELVLKGKYVGVRVEDEALALEILAAVQGPPAPEKPAAKRSSKDQREKAASSEEIPPEKTGVLKTVKALVKTGEDKTFTKFDAFIILGDQDMVDELRRRGYTVTCIKHIEL
jgi:hypothetical protein